MCLAIPALVTEILPDDMARVSLEGVSKIISLALVADVAVGDYVILHVGYALTRLDAAEAERTLTLLDEATRRTPAVERHEIRRRIPRRRARPALAATIRAEAVPGAAYAFMEFCGGHTHAISRYGIEDLLPPVIRMIHGPGCPVCVLPVGRIDAAIALAHDPRVTLCTYADLMRVPASRGNSLQKAKAAGADIRMVYSTLDALASPPPSRRGRWCSSPSASRPPRRPPRSRCSVAARDGLANFSVFCNHVLTPVAMRAILATDGADRCARRVRRPRACLHRHRHRAVPAGRGRIPQAGGGGGIRAARRYAGRPSPCAPGERGRAEVENQYIRAVTAAGNVRAQAAVTEVFELRDRFEWRGLGWVPHSALRLRPDTPDSTPRRGLHWKPRPPPTTPPANAPPSCGEKRPAECRLFGTACTPEAPMGSCMVSAEGACAAHWTYGRFRLPARLAS